MRIHTRAALETEDLGRRVASARPARDPAFAVLNLEGELGAGKTTFARGFLRALGVAQTVRSPSYTLVELYPAAAATLVHVDLYRLRDPAELEALGLREWAGPGHLWLVEWPQRAADRLPAPDLTLTFSVGVSGHDVEVTPGSALGKIWLGGLAGEDGRAGAHS